ncbi:MAG: hypothetical protein VYB89_12910, partial [Pseudomonadota bacterium]|nr:hypothetical protein [Pseudomonadota bacterium]
MAPPKARARRRWLPRLTADGLVVLAVAIWWAFALDMPEFLLPGPGLVATRIWELFTDPLYLGHVVASSARVVVAVMIAVTLGAVLAFLPRWLPITEVIVHERIKPFLNSFPS